MYLQNFKNVFRNMEIKFNLTSSDRAKYLREKIFSCVLSHSGFLSQNKQTNKKPVEF